MAPFISVEFGSEVRLFGYVPSMGFQEGPYGISAYLYRRDRRWFIEFESRADRNSIVNGRCLDCGVPLTEDESGTCDPCWDAWVEEGGLRFDRTANPPDLLCNKP